MKKLLVSLDKKLNVEDKICACIGYFDGLHLGHQKLIEQTKIMAQEQKCKSGLITFFPDPWVIIKNQKDIKHLTTFERREELCAKFGLDYFIVLDFNLQMANLEPDIFIEMLKQCNVIGLVSGKDFSFGKMGKGNSEFLTNYPIAYRCVELLDDNGEKISSTRISNLIINGDVKEANRLLGHPYTIEGIVINGNAKGRTIGFPTANIDYDKELLMLKNGVYVVKVHHEKMCYIGILNIGFNPTFNKVNKISVEVHILNFDKQIYGEKLMIEVIDRIRDEVMFDSVSALISQLESDKAFASRYF